MFVIKDLICYGVIGCQNHLWFKKGGHFSSSLYLVFHFGFMLPFMALGWWLINITPFGTMRFKRYWVQTQWCVGKIPANPLPLGLTWGFANKLLVKSTIVCEKIKIKNPLQQKDPHFLCIFECSWQAHSFKALCVVVLVIVHNLCFF
jgi:hypothetical protein